MGIVGISGAGKSTLTELLLRFYDPQKCQIIVNGLDLKDLDLATWRKKIGVVSQDIFLFNDTISSNIAFAQSDATQYDIEEAARKAHAHEFILSLPKGYNTLVGDRGVLLSGGQKQRIAIARAIIIEPEILIFDEATSSLDSKSENYIQNSINNLIGEKTMIIIAHRLSTIKKCNYIYLLEKGRIIQEGTWDKMVYDKNSMFSKMCQLQGIDN